MARFCGKCGTPLNESTKFCPKCGTAAEVQQAPPPQYAPPPPVQQQYAPPPPVQQHFTPPPVQPQYAAPMAQAPVQGGSKKTLFIIIAAAAAAAVIILLLAMNVFGPGNAGSTGDEEAFITIDVVVDKDPPPGREPPPFEMGDPGFYTDDPNIKMIEVNQCLSYGFDTEIGDFYLIENFVAGKETGIFVVLENPVDPTSEMTLTVHKDDGTVGVLTPAKMIDDNTVLFQPKDMSEMKDWGEGSYAFVFNMDGSEAVRITNFLNTTSLSILAVPMKINYGGDIKNCSGEWMDCQQMILDTFPIAKADLDCEFGPELDLSDPKYDITNSSGQLRIWRALKDLQTPDEKYTLILGFMPDKATDSQGTFLGYTFGMPANIICEGAPDMLCTVVHEISHCYMIGDEYPNGSLNVELNVPPYQMEGHDIVTGQYAVGENDKVVRGDNYGVSGSGSVVYPDQRAYRVHDMTMLGSSSSYMGWATGDDSYSRWTTSEIYNHLFDSFTGKSVWSGGKDTNCLGQCPKCYGDVCEPVLWHIKCRDCYTCYDIYANGGACSGCGKKTQFDQVADEDWYLECENCKELVWEMEFNEFNSGGENFKKIHTEEDEELIMITQVKGCFEPAGTFVSETWYSYPAPYGFITVNKTGEYSVCVYDNGGKLIDRTYFDLEVSYQRNTADGPVFDNSAMMPIDIIMKYPENGDKFVIQKGDKELFTRYISKNTPTVEFTGITFDKNNENIVTVTWEASDADGDDLYFDLFYDTADDVYYQIAFDLTENTFTVDMSTFPGSETGYFYIYASDGINTAETQSDYFNVAFKGPFIVADNSKTIKSKASDEILFDPRAYDNTDGHLKADKVKWLVDGVPFAATGKLLIKPNQLRPGTYIFTCEATNSKGQTTTKDFKVEIM